MSSVQKYAAVNAKVRALKSRLLRDEDYKNMLAMENEVEIVRYLKEKTGYSHVLKDIDPDSYNRQDFEFCLRKAILDDYDKITHFLTGESKQVFRVLTMVRYEVEDLKLILRSISRGEDPAQIAGRFLRKESFTGVNREELVKARSIEDFIEQLKGTIFYRPLKTLTQEDMEKRQFHMEMNMDNAYFNLLFKHIEKLDPEDRELMLMQVGTNVDLQNIHFIYRALAFYKLTGVEIFNYALPFGYYLKGKTLKRICFSETPENFMTEMKSTHYWPLLERGISDIFMERAMSQALYDNYQTVGSMNITQVIEYYHRIEFEMRDIISITEAVGYGMEYDDARKYLIRRI